MIMVPVSFPSARHLQATCVLALTLSACSSRPIKHKFVQISDIGSVSTPGEMTYVKATDT